MKRMQKLTNGISITNYLDTATQSPVPDIIHFNLVKQNYSCQFLFKIMDAIHAHCLFIILKTVTVILLGGRNGNMRNIDVKCHIE